MKKKLFTVTGKPVVQTKKIRGSSFALQAFTLCGFLLLMALFLWVADSTFVYGTSEPDNAFFGGIRYLKNALLWVLFFAGIVCGCVGGIVCLFSKGPLFRLEPPDTKPFEMELGISADSVTVSYHESVPVYKTPWSKVEQDALYRCRFSWDTVEKAYVESSNKVAPLGFLCVRGASEYTKTVNGTTESLKAAAYRKKFNCAPRTMYIWLEPPMISAVDQELTRYFTRKED